ncbi:hypothetical protein ABIA16_003808 [Sinorhizobium fredii]
MSEMVERVAKAMASADNNGQDGAWQHYTRLASAAIESMREPTEFMISIGACHEDPSEYYTGEFKLGIKDEGDIAREVYVEMIDAAICEVAS